MAELSELVLTCPKGLESLLLDEATGLGLEGAKAGAAVLHGRGSLETAYRLCLWSRLANRVLLVLARFPVESAETMYQSVRQVPWDEHLLPDGSLAVEFSGTGNGIDNTHFGALKVKDAVVDVLREKFGQRPRIDKLMPDLRIHLRLHRGEAVLSLDLSGQSLHQRGYRLQQGAAPLKENLAAAILLRADWPQQAAAGQALVDPMCGVGTLLVEAGLMAADVAPNLRRTHWGFSNWLGHVPVTWQRLLDEAQGRADAGLARPPLWIRGYEADPRLMQPARNNIERAGLAHWIKVYQGELASFAPHPDQGQTGLVVTNPPYGQRLGDEASLVYLYQHLGERLRQQCCGWQAAVFTGTPELGKRMGLRTRKQYAFWNGALPCRLLLFDVREESFVAALRGQGDHENPAAPPEDQNISAPKPVAESRSGTGDVPPLSAGAGMFANRLEKNLKRLRKWVQREAIQCYRVYDADMPEYAVAIDLYRDWVHVQEYAPPKTVDESRARERLHEVLSALPSVLGVAPDRVVMKKRQRQTGLAQYERQAEQREFLQVEEGRARLLVNLRDYLDTGLFLDHRPLRLRIGREAAGKRFLNLFCYTGTATVHAALGGARDTTSVDMSRTYLDWASRNLALNGFSEKHRLVQGDVLEWLPDDDERFDLILLDPPTFSNSKRMSDVFDVQKDHAHLVRLTMARLESGGVLYFSNNFRKFKLDAVLASEFSVQDISAQTLDPDFQRRPGIHHAWRITHAGA